MVQCRILVADDDEGARQLLKEVLTLDDFEVLLARDGDEALRLFGEGALDVAILDIMMPGKDGLEVLRELRKSSDIPVIMLSGKADESDKVGALELGADDYVTKPFRANELLARIGAVLRRSRTPAPTRGQPDFDDGRLRIEFARRRVILDGREVSLTRTEFDLLRELVAAGGAPLEYRHILKNVWGSEYVGDERELVQAVAKRLRSKIEPDPRSPRYILNVEGFGYRFRGSQPA